MPDSIVVNTGVRITGALGLLAHAKRLGFAPVLRPLINGMTHSGIWYDPALIARVLVGVGE